ncbi:hypothetical protein KUTeg_008614 [Tegillarca granosa]|uniref:Uncharacterized protein n=1 Tax=Tegillarca granosa TaxID=220873 RepID=A0ABQ9FEG7_TEGGR|nr:hypothetical protein KUTeg_008614 [Tegillarca granosa]
MVNLNEEQQKRFYLQAALACSRRITTETSQPAVRPGLHCNISFDGVMCWPYTKAGAIAVQGCPGFIHGFNTRAKAYRYCTSSGEWYFDEELNVTVADYSSCIQPPDPSLIQWPLRRIKTNVRKLHCQRNTIHINLFFSFILRSLVCLIKDTDSVPPGDVISVNGTLSHITDTTNWRCKLLFTLFQYLLTCNYMWIFVEGLYLYILIFFVIFQKKKLLKLFIIIGWICPLLSVVPWVIVNFFFFINIIRVLFTKLSAENTRDPRRYKKLVKSTLVLIPLFGVYYVIFIGIPDCLEEKYQSVSKRSKSHLPIEF